MKRWKTGSPWKLCALTSAAMLGLAACGGTGSEEATDSAAATGETITLKVADSRSLEHYAVAGGVIPWMERIEELTDGAVAFEHYPAEQLGSLSDSLSLLRGGVADIAYVPPSFFAGEMPLSEVHSLPGIFTDSVEASKAFQAASTETAIAEVDYEANGVKHLWGAMTWPGEIFTVGKRIETLDDLEGMRIRGSGGALESALTALGATTVTLPTTEVYQALETGTAAGTAMAHASVLSYSVHEVTDYATKGLSLGSFWMPMVMSESSWNALPADVQEAFETANEEAVVMTAEAIEEATEAAIAEMEAEGVEIVELPESDQARAQELYEPIAAEWIAEAPAAGHSEAQDVYDFITDRVGAAE